MKIKSLKDSKNESMNKSTATKNGIQMYKFLRYYESMHPTKIINDGVTNREKRFDLCDQIGQLVPCKKFIKKTSPMSR